MAVRSPNKRPIRIRSSDDLAAGHKAVFSLTIVFFHKKIREQGKRAAAIFLLCLVFLHKKVDRIGTWTEKATYWPE